MTMNPDRKSLCKDGVAPYEQKVENVFGKIGAVLCKNPVKILVCCATINVLFAIGFINIKFQNDVELLYTPENSKSLQDRKLIEDLYTNPTGNGFSPYQLTRAGLFGDILITSKNNSNIMGHEYIEEINEIDNYITTAIIVQGSNHSSYRYNDLCATGPNGCGVLGNIILSPNFQIDFIKQNVTYPYYNNISISSTFANAVSENGILQYTSGIRLRYYLRQNTNIAEALSKLWGKSFVEKMTRFQTNLTSIAVSHSDSLNSELDNIIESATLFFMLTLIFMMVYASFSAFPMNCNNVANRMNLGFAGILAALLAIASSFGLVSATGLETTTVVGVLPFLVIGIGIDDMFILMSGMADAPPLPEATVEERMIYMLKKSGIPITITSLTDILAFMIGASSVFVSIRIFCIFTGVAVFFCLMNQLFFLCPAIAINEMRTEKKRHFCLCSIEVKSRDNYAIESKSKCFIQCCAGHHPKTRDEVEGPMEKYPKRLIYLILHKKLGKCFVIIIFLSYLISSIYGAIHLEQGMLMYKLVPEGSYYRKYSIWDETYFKTEPVITLCITGNQQYSSQTTQNRISSLLSKAKEDLYIDDNFEINWFDSYKASICYNATSEKVFISGLRMFLKSDTGKYFKNDIVFAKNYSSIKSSKLYIKSLSLKTSTEKGDFLLRMRSLEKSSLLSCIVFSPFFILCEQYVQILPSTLQTVGIALAVILFVKFIFMPNVLLVGVVALNIISILVGVFGFMHFWNLSLNSMTMRGPPWPSG